ncbi:MAG TPA: hypothetical protein VFM55_04475 [Micromonosporaceae bacterium]|nr:hypothetical protein [Micromonosporaceae bacterium]
MSAISTEGPHPSWCHGSETEGCDHVSYTLHASVKDDIIDVRLRLTQPSDMEIEATVEITFVDDEEIVKHSIPLHQARMVADMIGELLP